MKNVFPKGTLMASWIYLRKYSAIFIYQVVGRAQLADLCLQDGIRDEDKFEIAVDACLIIWSDFFLAQASRDINNLNN